MEGLVNTGGRVEYGIVPGLQCHRVHAGSRESFFIRSLHELSHWKNMIVAKVVARGNQGNMGTTEGSPARKHFRVLLSQPSSSELFNTTISTLNYCQACP